jgi:hypothetical protein
MNRLSDELAMTSSTLSTLMRYTRQHIRCLMHLSCNQPQCLQAGHTLTQLGLMAHLCGVLSNAAPAAHAARTAALSAITSLCSHQSQAQINFLHYGGINAVLQTLLQADRADDEILAAVTLLEHVLAPMHECRDIMEKVRGMEVLAQLHREAAHRGSDALMHSTVMALAKLTFRHPKNLASLQSDTNLLGNHSLYSEVVAIHERSITSPRGPTALPLYSLDPAVLPTLSTASTLSEQASNLPTTPRAVPTPRMSLDGSSRALRRMSSSVRNMLGSVRKLMRNNSTGEEEAVSAASLQEQESASRLVGVSGRVCVA